MLTVLNHCEVRGCEVYCGMDSHIVLHEQGGAAQIGGVTVCALPNNPDGSFELRQLEERLRSDRLHEPLSRLVAVENTIGGRVVPQTWIRELAKFARQHELKMHLDGARLWNASVASGLAVDELAADFDSVTFCLSKGLGAPVGSLLCGSRNFIEKTRRTRKVLGGGMRQAGVLAAAGLVALDQVVPLLKEDHQRARILAIAISEAKSPFFRVDLGVDTTNMVMVSVESPAFTAKDFVARLQEAQDTVEEDRILVRALALSNKLARFVTYYEITDQLLEAAIKKIVYVIQRFELLV
jgi:threonine aldolase